MRKAILLALVLGMMNHLGLPADEREPQVLKLNAVPPAPRPHPRGSMLAFLDVHIPCLPSIWWFPIILGFPSVLYGLTSSSEDWVVGGNLINVATLSPALLQKVALQNISETELQCLAERGSPPFPHLCPGLGLT